VGLLSGSFLATVGILTKERVELNKQREVEAAIIKVVPGTESSTKLYEAKDFKVYGGKNQDGTLIGYGILVSGIGFQDKITLMLGTDISLTKTTRLEIIEQKETPGLGAKIEDEDVFLKFWEGRDCSQAISLRKPAVKTAEELAASEVNTITGATISSESVLKIVNNSVEKLRQLIKEGQIQDGEQDVH
ncbi:MAG: FMN-binding protein, partial [Candidatus Aminicenantes bacterium]|nr:FMN-binding protein [Candidatus Aminicenantes bacterium]